MTNKAKRLQQNERREVSRSRGSNGVAVDLTTTVLEEPPYCDAHLESLSETLIAATACYNDDAAEYDVVDQDGLAFALAIATAFANRQANLDDVFDVTMMGVLMIMESAFRSEKHRRELSDYTFKSIDDMRSLLIARGYSGKLITKFDT